MWKFLKGGATVIPGATFIPESRVNEKKALIIYFHHTVLCSCTARKLNQFNSIKVKVNVRHFVWTIGVESHCDWFRRSKCILILGQKIENLDNVSASEAKVVGSSSSSWDESSPQLHIVFLTLLCKSGVVTTLEIAMFFYGWMESRTTDTQWRHKSKIKSYRKRKWQS